DRDLSKKEFYQFIVNTTGSLYNKSPDAGKKWNSNTKVAVLKNKDNWTIEMAVPLASFLCKPASGEKIGLNIYRNRWVNLPKNDDSSWSCPFGPNATPDRFGVLNFE
ncbi:MAG: hypothetical protein V1752_04030, partial [Candidatus Firestonebacteria bacterium]